MGLDMTEEELNNFDNLTKMLEVARDFKYGGDFDMLSYGLTKAYNNLRGFDDENMEVLGEALNKIVKTYKSGQRVKKNPQVYNDFCSEVYKIRAPYEPRYVEKILEEQGVEGVKKYLSEKSDEDLDICMEEILSDYRGNRTDENREKWNKVLGIFNKKIVKVSKRKLSLDERKLIRCVFEGAFVIPTAGDNKKGIGNSKRYQKFLNGEYEVEEYHQSQYSFGATHIDRILSTNKDTERLKKRLHRAVLKNKMPPKVYKDLNISDVGMIFLLEYGKSDTVKKLRNGSMKYCPPFPFRNINMDCSQGQKREFKDMLNSDEKMKNLLERYKKQGEDVFIHHKYYIFDAGSLDDMFEINDSGNLMNVAGEKNHKNILHGVDYAADDYVERLVDTQDGIDGKNLILFAGWRYNVYLEDNSTKTRETYLTKAISENQGR